MTLTYKLELEDWLAFNRFYRQTSPVLQSQLRTSRILVTVTLMGVLFSLFSIGAKRIEPLTLGIILIVGLGAYFWMGLVIDKNSDKSARRIYESGQNKTLRDPVTLSISADHLATASPLSESKMKWPLVEKIMSTSEHVFIYISANNALIIPKRAFASEEQRQQCIALLQRYHSVVYA